MGRRKLDPVALLHLLWSVAISAALACGNENAFCRRHRDTPYKERSAAIPPPPKGRPTMASERVRVAIVGSGPAGYTAAIYAARAMLEPVLIQGAEPGGQLTITTDVENYPGFAKVIQGPWLMEEMRAQAEHVGTRIVSDTVTKLDLSRRPFRLDLESGGMFVADAVFL